MASGARHRWQGRDAPRGVRPIAALWTLIAVTLLSALAPIGPPLSQGRGSAFNPATSEVVLKARSPLGSQGTPVVRPRGLIRLAMLAACVLAMLLLARRTGRRALTVRPALAARAFSLRAKPWHARAPPRA